MLTNPKINDRVVVAPGFVPEARCIPDSVGAAIAGKVGVVMELLDEGGDLGACVIFPGQSHTWAFDYSDLKPAPTETPTPCPECAALRAEVSAATELFADAGLVGHKVGVPGVPALAPSAARACDEVIALRARLDILLHAMVAITAEVGLPPEGCDPETVCASVAALRARTEEAERERDAALRGLLGAEHRCERMRAEVTAAREERDAALAAIVAQARDYDGRIAAMAEKQRERTAKVRAQMEEAEARASRLEAILAAERGERGLEGWGWFGWPDTGWRHGDWYVSPLDDGWEVSYRDGPALHACRYALEGMEWVRDRIAATAAAPEEVPGE